MITFKQMEYYYVATSSHMEWTVNVVKRQNSLSKYISYI